MKIGITTFGCDGGKSGIGQYIVNLLRSFSAFSLSGGNNSFETLCHQEESDIFIPEDSSIQAYPISSAYAPATVNIFWHQFMLPSLCRKREYDVLFLPAANRRAPLKVPCPAVGTVHDFSSLHVAEKYDPFRMFYIKKVLPALIRRLDQILTVSESSKRDIVEYAQVPENRVTVVPLAAEPETYYPRPKPECAERIGRKYGVTKPYIFFISRIEHPGKNHYRLIRAFARLKSEKKIPHQLVLAGSDWGRADIVHRAAEDSGCAEDIIFTGYTPGCDLPDFYCGADAFLFPSLYEGFGLPVLEAMTCGVPVACSNVSSIPEIAGDAALQFDPYDEEAIADAMFRLLEDESLREDCIQKGWKRSGLYSWEITARKTLDVLHRAAEQK